MLRCRLHRACRQTDTPTSGGARRREPMPPAAAAAATPTLSPPGSAVAPPHRLGFSPCRDPPPAGPPQPGTPPRRRPERVPDTEDEPRTPGSAEFFLREPGESSDDDTASSACAAFTYEQHLQLRAQLYVLGDLEIGKPPAEQTMAHAFGEPAEGQKHVWLEEWHAAVKRWESQKSKVPGYDTPTSSSIMGSCTGEQCRKDTTVEKSSVSEQGDTGEKKTRAGLLWSGKPRHRSESVPDTEDDVRTPGSAEFFSREPPESSDDNTTLAHTVLTYEQTIQRGAQVHFCEDLMLVKPPVEHTFGEPAEDQKHVWQDEWRSSVDRWESQKSKVPGYDTPPRSSLMGSCTGAQGSKDTTAGKSSVSEQAGTLQSGKPPKGSEPVPDTEGDPKTPGSAEFFLREPPECSDDDATLAQRTFTYEQTLQSRAQVHLSGNLMLEKTPVGNTMVHAFGEPTSSLIGSCRVEECSQDTTTVGKGTVSEQGDTGEKEIKSLDVGRASIHAPKNTTKYTDMLEQTNGSCSSRIGTTFVSEQHSSDGGEEISQGPDFGSDWNHLGESNMDKFDNVISNDINNDLEEHTFYSGTQSLLDPCFKCGKHGQLLKCYSCPIAAHLSCFGPFGSSVRANDGMFYCPVCICLKATEAQKKADKTLSEARKDLSAFLLVKPSAKQHCEQCTGNQQLPSQDEEHGHEKRNDASDACPELNYDSRTSPARTRRRLAPRRRSFVSTARRTWLPWTAEEEAALREAVARFAPRDKGRISWIRIWEHGLDVFHPARLPKNLRQKWYDMKKRRSKASQGSGAFKI